MSDILSMIEEDAENRVSTPSDDGLKTVSSIAEAIVAQQELLDQAEKSVKDIKKALLKLTDEELPSAMAEHNLSRFTLQDGTEITVKPTYGASIKVANREKAYQWLRDHDYGDIIKNTVSVAFGQGEDQKANELISSLRTQHFAPTQEESVHNNTLKAWVRERIEKGQEIDMELFGVYVGQRAVVKKEN